MKIRIKFRKNGVMRFVGHLDLMRYFQKAMRRAGIDLAYTEGYHPHPIMSFAAPLGIGLTSDGEYMDIVVNTSLNSRDAIDAINNTMAEGMQITEYVLLPDESKGAMASLAAADYIVYFKHREDFTQQEIEEGLHRYLEDRDSIEVTKTTKKGERVVDIKPLLYQAEPYSDNRSISDRVFPATGKPDPTEILSDLGIRNGYILRLGAGSTDNIRPELMLADFYSFLEASYDPHNMQIHRLELYERSGDKLIPLSYAGKEIRP